MRPPFTRNIPASMLQACVLLALPLAALVLPASAAAQTVTMNRDGRDVRITIGDAAVLPADFPAEVPLPSVHTVLRVDRSGGDTTVLIATPGSVEDEAARFRAGMIAAGWKPAAVRPPPVGIAQAWRMRPRAVIAWIRPVDAGGVEVQLQVLAPAAESAPAPAAAPPAAAPPAAAQPAAEQPTATP